MKCSQSQCLPREYAIEVLTSVPFGLALTVLVLNDWILKAAVGNWVTGKLSDVAGLAAFAMFWSAAFPRHPRRVFVGTAAAFILWKSPLSDAPLHAWNALGVWPMARVADYSDLLALAVLLPTYRALPRIEHQSQARLHSFARAGRAFGTGLIAIMAFSATSVRHLTPLEPEGYTVSAARGDVIAALDSIQVSVSHRPKRRDASSADTMVVHMRHPPERWLSVTIEVRDMAPREAQILPLFMHPLTGPEPSDEGWRRAFVAQVVEPLREWLVRRERAIR